MACKHPLYAVVTGVTSSGKKQLEFCQFNYWHYPKSKLVQIPCGKCIACRLEYSRQWANRCMLELQYHESSYFVTLTYNDEHLPLVANENENGEITQVATLVKREFQLFLKRLRKRFPDQEIRYYMAGEYGDQGHRPHYHAILFGLKLDDLVFYKKSPLGFNYYFSPTLEKLWSDSDGSQKGFVVVADVTWESCAYTARYVMKKQKGFGKEMYEKLGIEPEFCLMSRRPGIGKKYYEDHPDLYKYDYINISTEKGGKKFKPPKYFDRLFELDNPDEFKKIKDARAQMAAVLEKEKLRRTSLDIEELRQVEEENLESRLKSLRRNIV